MIVVEPVIELPGRRDFGLWPVAEAEPFSFMALDGTLTPDQVGTAVMALAVCNEGEPDDDGPPCPADPLGRFLHGLLTVDSPEVPGGLRVTDTQSGVRFVPGCCCGLEDRGDWLDVLDGDGRAAWFGHDPSPGAERRGDVVRLTVDAEADPGSGRWIDVPARELRRLLAGAERDLAGFLDLAARWAATSLPAHCAPVGRALGRALRVRA
ncbi:hypothetical protein [Streptomyces sp. VRA16 Mangrove soil]|uniref:hypothetical protein n=1 Tax=Streptomyces sp. VRA16 Mangrove soil TaxID=2817434 RepID=UPI001A9D069B|nr:hypothetical protein [Streptomyces sp. VRA16 Mangrove soil]MBO1337474.1 hypothetical protein [Streptomyces sp. VRA16 Mangrove soil]